MRNARRCRRLTLTVKSDRLDLSLRSCDVAQGFVCVSSLCPVCSCWLSLVNSFPHPGAWHLSSTRGREGEYFCSEAYFHLCTKKGHKSKIIFVKKEKRTHFHVCGLRFVMHYSALCAFLVGSGLPLWSISKCTQFAHLGGNRLKTPQNENLT